MVGMKYFKQWVLFICLSVYCSASAQEVKKAMTFDEMVSWKRITEQKISHDGKWVACKIFSSGCTGRIFCIFRLPARYQEAGT